MNLGRSLLIVLVLSMLVACASAGNPPDYTDASPPLKSPSTDARLPSAPPVIVGEITEIANRMLVEQNPGATIGDKIFFSFSDETSVFRAAGAALQPATIDDLEVGQRVEVWTSMVAESFPGQARAEVIVIDDGAAEATPEAAAPPDREPDVEGVISQASNTVLIDNNFLLFITPTTQFFRRSGDALEVIDAREITEGRRIAGWVHEISYGGSPPRGDAIAIVVLDD